MRRPGRLWIIVAAVFTVGLMLGWYVDREPVPARPIDQTTAVDPGWYDRLPLAVSTGLLVRRYGGRWGMPSLGDIATLPVLWGLFLLWGYVSLPATNAVARVYERQADLFGLNSSQAPHGMAEFMIHDADVARLRPTSLEYALFYTHPSDAERVAMAMQWRAEAKAHR